MADHRYSVVVTRSAEDNRGLTTALQRLGLSVLQVPLVEVSAPADGGRALAEAAARLDDYRWVVLTSVNGVRALEAALESDSGSGPVGDADSGSGPVGDASSGSGSIGGSWPVGVTVAPVGPTTAAAARAAGMVVAEPPPQATAASLVDNFEPWDGTSGRRVLAPLAELAGPTVVDGLSAKGYRVDRVDAYRTAAPTGSGSGAAAVMAADAVTFFSPSVVDRFLDRFGATVARLTAICIGPSTAARAEAGGFTTVITADPHTEAGVVSALARLTDP